MKRKKRARSAGQNQGRPQLENGRRKVLASRLSEAEHEACELAAQREGKSLSEWARMTLLLRAAACGG
jgi:predicted HicB family RNase H-like nuclease